MVKNHRRRFTARNALPRCVEPGNGQRNFIPRRPFDHQRVFVEIERNLNRPGHELPRSKGPRDRFARSLFAQRYGQRGVNRSNDRRLNAAKGDRSACRKRNQTVVFPSRTKSDRSVRIAPKRNAVPKAAAVNANFPRPARRFGTAPAEIQTNWNRGAHGGRVGKKSGDSHRAKNRHQDDPRRRNPFSTPAGRTSLPDHRRPHSF